MSVVVVVPTYNERGNITPLVEALMAQASALRHGLRILIVDDNSPDGTQDAVRELQARFTGIDLLPGEKRGLGVAYARGLDHAVRAMSADIVVHMDADFSHDPADLPRLVAKIDEGYDFVVGARYVEGGGLPVDWGWKRRAISRLANFGTSVIAGIGALHDCTNGYRAYRAPVLAGMDLPAAPKGYAVLTFLAYQALMSGARFAEVPVVFSNRAKGTSKLRMSDVREFFFNTWWIRYDRRERFYRRATGGLSGVGANLLALAALHHGLGVPALAASAAAVEVSVLYSFAWKQMWRVALKKPAPGMVPGLLSAHAYAVPSAALTVGTFALVSAAGAPPLVAQAAGIVPAMLWNYFAGDRTLDLLRRRNILHDVQRPDPDSTDEVIHGRSA